MTSTIEIGEAVRVSMPGGLFLHGDIQEVNADSVKVKGRWFSVADVKTEEEIEQAKKDNVVASRRLQQAEADAKAVAEQALADFLKAWSEALHEDRRREHENRRRVAYNNAVADGWALHRQAEDCEDIVPENNPEAFAALVNLAFACTATITLSSPPSESEAWSDEMHNYVIPIAKETTHGLKSNVALQNSKELGDLQRVLNFNVHTNGWTNGFSEVEICSKTLAKALGERGIISERELCKPKSIEGENDDSRS
jgi:hypothetical protein